MTISTALFRPKSVAKVGIFAAALFTLHAGESKASRIKPPPGPGETLTTLTCSIPSIIGGTCNGGDITVGDKKLTDFDFSGLEFLTTDTMTFTSFGPGGIFHQFQYNFTPPAESPFSGSFSYRVSITPAGLALGNTFSKIQSNITGSTEGTGSFFTSVSTNPAVSPVASVASSSNILPGDNPGNNAFFGPGVTSAIFSQSFNLAGVSPNVSLVNSLGVTLTQKTATESVPGPLPILGAGAAFGFSRKLRRRVQRAA
jgi:hypothetical protein